MLHVQSHAGLRYERKPQPVAHFRVLFDAQTAEERACVFARDSREEIHDAYEQKGYAGNRAARTYQRVEFEVYARAHEEQKQYRRRKIVELLKEFVVLCDVAIHRAHRHTTEKRRYVQNGAQSAEREYDRDCDDESIVRGMFAQKQFEQKSECAAHHEYENVVYYGQSHVFERYHPCHRSGCNRNGNRKRHESHHVVERDDL